MILTKQFLSEFESCKEGYRYVLEHDLLNKDYDYVIKALKEQGQIDHAEWLEAQKGSEAYVKFGGVRFMVTAYQVFCPIEGVHKKYQTEEEAKEALIKASLEVIKIHGPRIVQELTNEHGDSTWVPTTIHENLKVIL